MADIVLVNAGSSAGSEDYTVHIFEELGEVFTRGVATRLGKPVVLGKVKDTIVIGLPGYPVSAYLALEWFVLPLICKYLGIPVPQRDQLEVILGRRIVSTMGSEDFIRMNVGYVNGQFVANPLTRAAGVTMSLVRADGLLVVPSERLGHEQGEYVTLELYKPEKTIKKAVLFSGSHDLSLDVISSMMKEQDVTRQGSPHTLEVWLVSWPAVKEGTASTGLGIYAAAKALDLDFIPISYESYDLIMRKAFFECESGHLLLEIIKSEDVACKLEKLRGYKLILNQLNERRE